MTLKKAVDQVREAVGDDCSVAVTIMCNANSNDELVLSEPDDSGKLYVQVEVTIGPMGSTPGA